jgi:hypothetical protein
MTQVVSIKETQVVAVSETRIQVLSVGAQGAAGVGIPAGGTTGQALVKTSDENFATGWAAVTAVAALLQQDLTLGETVSAYRMVYADLDGKIYAASSDDVLTAQAVRGITTQAGDEDDAVNVVLTGEVTNGGWAWTGNQDLFLGVDGIVTNVPPTSGFSLRVGYSVTATKMVVDIGGVIIL